MRMKIDRKHNEIYGQEESMRRTGDQDTATGMISLGLLANGLELLLSTGKDEPLPS